MRRRMAVVKTRRGEVKNEGILATVKEWIPCIFQVELAYTLGEDLGRVSGYLR